MFAFKSVHLRLIMMVVLPIALFLIVTSILEYVYIRTIILEEWQASTTLRLERASRQIDVRLRRLVSGMQAFARTGGTPLGDQKQEWLLKRLQEQEGVSLARFIWKEPGSASEGPKGKPEKPGTTPSRRIITVSPPQYFFFPEKDAIILQSVLMGMKKQPLGHLEVEVTMAYLMQGLKDTGWKASNLLCLVDKDGRYLAHPDPAMKGRHCLGESRDELEVALLQAMQENPSGTLLGPGYITDRVVWLFSFGAGSLGHRTARYRQANTGAIFPFSPLLFPVHYPEHRWNSGAHALGIELHGGSYPKALGHGSGSGPRTLRHLAHTEPG